MMGFFDFLQQLFRPGVWATQFTGLNEVHRGEKPHVEPIGHFEDGRFVVPTPTVIPDPSIRETITPPGVPAVPSTSPLPQRYGTFLFVDLYPGDLGGKPDWKALERNSKVDNCEVVGAILKATEGVSYGYTGWFTRNGQQLRDLWFDRMGHDRFMGAYHFLQLGQDGRQQAEFFVRTMETINMPQRGVDLYPFIDFEQGGQRDFWPTDCPKDTQGHYELDRLPSVKKMALARRAMDTARTCAARIKELTGFIPMLYGRGLQRDLNMTTISGFTVDQLRMGCRGAWNPAYTEHMPPMDAYGWPLDRVPLWQYGGDGVSAHPKLPKGIPGFGATDLSVHIDGPRRTSLDSLRKSLVCQ